MDPFKYAKGDRLAVLKLYPLELCQAVKVREAQLHDGAVRGVDLDDLHLPESQVEAACRNEVGSPFLF